MSESCRCQIGRCVLPDLPEPEIVVFVKSVDGSMTKSGRKLATYSVRLTVSLTVLYADTALLQRVLVPVEVRSWTLTRCASTGVLLRQGTLHSEKVKQGGGYYRLRYIFLLPSDKKKPLLAYGKGGPAIGGQKHYSSDSFVYPHGEFCFDEERRSQP